MNSATESEQGHGTAEREAQRALTERVGGRLGSPTKASSRKWSTWKARVTPRREGRE